MRSLWSGHPEITELVIVRPVLNVPLLRERKPAPSAGFLQAGGCLARGRFDAPTIERITVTDGTVAFSNLRDRVDNRIDGINADATVGADRKIRVTGSAHAGGHPLKFDIKATAPAPPLERQNVPVELTLDAPGLLQAPLSGKAEVRLNGIGGHDQRPLRRDRRRRVQRLGVGRCREQAAGQTRSRLPAARHRGQPGAAHRRIRRHFASCFAIFLAASSFRSPGATPRSTLTGLNYVDAQVRLSAAELNIGDAHFAPAAIDATLAGGVLKCAISNLGAYGGQANGEVDIDVSGGNPSYALRGDLVGVRALPLLRSAAGFDKLDGKLQAKIAVRSNGPSQRAIMSNLDGTVFADVPGRRDPRPQRRADDPLADLEPAVGMAGGPGADHRPDASSPPRSASSKGQATTAISIWSGRW